MANGSEYALTGGLFSRSPAALARRAERELVVGNVYLNRGITGAIVERHPFGGFKLSGGGTKAGGKGYIENFVFQRVVVENVLRRRFTPARGVTDLETDGQTPMRSLRRGSRSSTGRLPPGTLRNMSTSALTPAFSSGSTMFSLRH
jgi:delta 1-pyrroline-5-carboxylate dehydrogenase